MEPPEARAQRKKRVVFGNLKSLAGVFSDFCSNTSAHGFQYLVSTQSFFERMFWVGIVGLGFIFASIMVLSLASQWTENPSSVAIKTFSKPANEVPFPAITICNEHGFDVGEYIRAVFDNFQYSCLKCTETEFEKYYNTSKCSEADYLGTSDCYKTELLRSHFAAYFDDGEGVSHILNITSFLREILKVDILFKVQDLVFAISRFPGHNPPQFCDDDSDDLAHFWKRNSLYPHYFSLMGRDPYTSLSSDIVTELISGTLNPLAWYRDMGFVISRYYLMFIGPNGVRNCTYQGLGIENSRYENLIDSLGNNYTFWDFVASFNDNYDMEVMSSV